MRGDVVYWLIIFITIIGAARLFGLPVEPVVGKLFIYLGLALMVALVIGLGLFFAQGVVPLGLLLPFVIEPHPVDAHVVGIVGG